MKKLLISALILIIGCQAAFAVTFVVGELTYEILYAANKTVEVRQMNNSALTSVDIPESVTNNGVTYSVTRIGYEAFAHCTGLTSVTIPNSVTSIGEAAFAGTAWYDNQPEGVVYAGLVAYKYKGTMPSGTSITFKDDTKGIADWAFYGCSGLTSVTIGNSVTSIGDYAFRNCSDLTSVTIGNSVTSIGSNAFSSCDGLESISVATGNTKYDSRDNCNAIIETATNTLRFGCKSTIIPNSVTSIGGAAFTYCYTLMSVTIPNSVTSIGDRAFRYCTGLMSVTIGNSVTSIGESAFSNCSSLPSVTIPNSVTTIGKDAFEDCSGLTNVTIGNSVTSIGRTAFYGTAWYNNQPNGVVYAGLVAYKYKGGMTSETSITLKDGTKGIADNAFSASIGLTSVYIPNSVTNIGNEAFRDCTRLTSVTIPNSVTNIGASAFSGCSVMKSITIGNSVTSIGSNAFSSCKGLESISVASGNTKYDSRDNCNAIIETATNTLIVGCRNSRIPYSVTSIGSNAFYGCTFLRNMTIPKSVTSIGYSAFSGCIGLTSMTIPNSVTSIGNAAFANCRGLESISVESGNTKYDSRNNCNAIIETATNTLICGCKNTIIPNSVTTIGYSAFYGCSGLTSVTIPNSVTSISDYAFYGCSGLTRIEAYPNPQRVSMGIYVFAGVPHDGTLHVLPKYLSAYQTTDQWKDFYNIAADLEGEAVKGDVNGDGEVGATDIACVVNVLAGLEDAAQYGGRADVTGDGGAVTAADIAAIVNILAGLEQ